MLAVNSYSQDYVDACRATVNAQLAAYADVKAAASPSPAIDAFEPLFFNHMLLALDAYFGHRARGLEGKDGNPLNEVRVLCTSILGNDGLLAVDKTIKLKPETSLLHYAAGDRIALTQDDFALLSGAFFDEIEKKYK